MKLHRTKRFILHILLCEYRHSRGFQKLQAIIYMHFRCRLFIGSPLDIMLVLYEISESV
jgi:hypothetical protein